MNEFEETILLADRILDRPSADPDDDLAMLARQFQRALQREASLLFGIRKHMNERGDDRCYISDNELYTLLPEGDTRPTTDTAVTLENCARFIACRQQGREYVSPERKIEQLEKELAALRMEKQSYMTFFAEERRLFPAPPGTNGQ